MVYQTPKEDWATGELVGADDLNRVEGNVAALKALADAAPAVIAEYATIGSYSRGSNFTTYADIDATNLSFTITPSTDQILLICGGIMGYALGGGGPHSWKLAYTIDGGSEVDFWECRLNASATVNYFGSTAMILIDVTADTEIDLLLRWGSDINGQASWENPSVVIMDVGSSA